MLFYPSNLSKHNIKDPAGFSSRLAMDILIWDILAATQNLRDNRWENCLGFMVSDQSFFKIKSLGSPYKLLTTNDILFDSSVGEWEVLLTYFMTVVYPSTSKLCIFWRPWI